MSPRPAGHVVTDRIYDALGGGITGPDEGTGWQLYTFLDEGVGAFLQIVEDLVRDSDLGPGWVRAMDVEEVPDPNIAWLGQFVGMVPGQGQSPADQRQAVRDVEGWERGTPAALIGATQRQLVAGGQVILTERYTSAYRLRVQTYAAQTPDPAAAEAAARRAKAGSLVLEYELLEGQSWQDVKDNFATWADVQAAYATWDDVRTDVPPP